MKMSNLGKISTMLLMLVFILPQIKAQNTGTVVSDTTPTVMDTIPVAAPTTTVSDTAEAKPKKEKEDKEGFNSKTRWGLRFGGTMSSQDFESGSYTEDPESKLGGDLGLVCSIPVGGGFFMVQPEIHWMQKGYKASDVPNRGDITSTLNYLEIPLLARLNFGGNVRLFGFLGPSLGFLLSGNYEDDNQTLDPTEYLSGSEVSGHIGAGIGIGTFELDLRYMAGLSDISDSENWSDVKNSSVGLGITLKL